MRAKDDLKGDKQRILCIVYMQTTAQTAKSNVRDTCKATVSLAMTIDGINRLAVVLRCLISCTLLIMAMSSSAEGNKRQMLSNSSLILPVAKELNSSTVRFCKHAVLPCFSTRTPIVRKRIASGLLPRPLLANVNTVYGW